jgi:hypothetical protein
VVSGRICSSSVITTGSPRRCGISTGTISSAKWPFFWAAAARWWLAAPNASWSAPRVGEAVEGHVVLDRHVAVLVADALAHEQVRRVRHGLHATGHDDLELAGPDELVGQRDGVEAAEAHLVDGECGGGHRDAGAGGGLAGRDLPGAGLQHLTHDHVLHLLRRDAGPLQRRLDRDLAEFRGGEVLQPAEQPAHRGAGAVDDHRTHGQQPPGDNLTTVR